MKKEKELLKLRRIFSPKYVLTQKLLEIYLFFALVIALCVSMQRIMYAVFTTLILILIIFSKLVIEKRKANQTVMKFFEDRIEFKGKMFLKTVERTLKYEEIKDITFTQGATFFEKRFQKAFGYGNIYIYPKQGTYITRGMQIELVENIFEKVEEIKSIIGDKVK